MYLVDIKGNKMVLPKKEEIKESPPTPPSSPSKKEEGCSMLKQVLVLGAYVFLAYLLFLFYKKMANSKKIKSKEHNYSSVSQPIF